MSIPTVTVGADPAAPPAPAAAPVAKNGVTVIDGRHASVIDARGRLIQVRKLTALDRMKLFRVVGAADSMNTQVVAYAILAGSVISIDGMEAPFPHAPVMLEVTVQRLDDEGLDAVAKALAAITPDEKEVAEAAENLSPART